MTKKPFRWTKRANQFRRLVEHPQRIQTIPELRAAIEAAIRDQLQKQGARPSEIAITLSSDLETFDQVVTFLGLGPAEAAHD